MGERVFVLTATDADGYRWYAASDGLSVFDSEGVAAPGPWPVMEPAIRSGGCCLAIAASTEATAVAVSGLVSARERRGRPIRDTVLILSGGRELSPAQRGAALGVVRSGKAPESLQELSDGIRSDPASPCRVTLDHRVVDRVLASLAAPERSDGADRSPDDVPRGVYRDTPQARERLSEMIAGHRGADRNGLLFAISHGAVPTTLTGADLALTTHRSATEIPAPSVDQGRSPADLAPPVSAPCRSKGRGNRLLVWILRRLRALLG